MKTLIHEQKESTKRRDWEFCGTVHCYGLGTFDRFSEINVFAYNNAFKDTTSMPYLDTIKINHTRSSKEHHCLTEIEF